jgi:TatD DNase family protein
MILVDTHCHLNFDTFVEDQDDVIARAAAAGIGGIIVPATDLENCPEVIALAERYEMVYAAVGVHPNSSAGWQESWLDQLRQLARHEKVVAIGEIGLDYYWDKSPHDVQQRALAGQLALAAELNLPVILHNRESDADLLRLLRESPLYGRDKPGVLHSFSSDWPVAQAALEMGYYLGFTGPVTYKSADGLRAIAARVPLERLLVETDAPFLAPQKYRGKRNEPAYVALIAERIAALHNIALEAVAQQTTSNARSLFQINN